MEFYTARTLSNGIDCLPVAVVNALNWAGGEIDYPKTVKHWWDKCGMIPTGSVALDPTPLLKEHRDLLSSRTLFSPAAWFLRQNLIPHLDSGQAAILGYPAIPPRLSSGGTLLPPLGHAMFVYGVGNGGVDIVSGPYPGMMKTNYDHLEQIVTSNLPYCSQFPECFLVALITRRASVSGDHSALKADMMS